MNTLNAISNCAFAASIIALPFLLVNWWKYMKNRPVDRLVTVRGGFPIKSVNFFFFSVATVMVTASIVTIYARRDAVNFIHSLSGDYSVFVNQQQVREPDKMIGALKEITPYWAHHSHPTTRIRIDIRSETRELALELGRDSSNPQEYWVFSLQPGQNSNNEIGRITTSAFDGY